MGTCVSLPGLVGMEETSPVLLLVSVIDASLGPTSTEMVPPVATARRPWLP